MRGSGGGWMAWLLIEILETRYLVSYEMGFFAGGDVRGSGGGWMAWLPAEIFETCYLVSYEMGFFGW